MSIAALTLALLCHAPTGAHPADGPDVDVRVLVARNRVQFTVVMNLAFVDAVVDTPRQDEDSIHALELPAYREELFAYLARTNRVRIDGVEVAPVCGTFDAEPGWRPDHFEVIAYLRDPKTLEVHGAARWRAPSTE